MRLRGSGNGNGSVLGTTASVRVFGGVTLPPEMPESLRVLRDSKRNSEIPEIVLLSPTLQAALGVAGVLEWGRVAGAAVEEAASASVQAPFPLVTGVAGLMEFGEEDKLALLDSREGTVILEPDFADIARFQAEEDNLAPRRRVFVESVHQPAQTTDGRQILIYARIESEEDLVLALAEGADALYLVSPPAAEDGFFVFGNEPLFRPDEDEDTQAAALKKLAERASGKPLFLEDDYRASLKAVLEAGAFADFTLCVPFRDDLPEAGIGELKTALKEEQEALESENISCRTPGTALRFLTLPSAAEHDLQLDQAEQFGAAALFLPSVQTFDTPERAKTLESFLLAASARLLRVGMISNPAALAECIGWGASGILLEAREVENAKQKIRTLSASLLREAVLQNLQNGTGSF